MSSDRHALASVFYGISAALGFVLLFGFAIGWHGAEWVAITLFALLLTSLRIAWRFGR